MRHNQGFQPGPASDFVAAFRKVHALALESGADNCVWVWWMATLDDADSHAYYPGDALVDWISWDPYRWAHDPETETAFETWQPSYLKALDRTLYAEKPLMISETGADIRTERGEVSEGDKVAAQWWRTTQDAAKRLPKIKAFIFFNSQQWMMDQQTPQSLNAYRTLIADPYFQQPHE